VPLAESDETLVPPRVSSKYDFIDEMLLVGQLMCRAVKAGGELELSVGIDACFLSARSKEVAEAAGTTWR
jgi:hypothetical protein